jgi:hypothetical protein
MGNSLLLDPTTEFDSKIFYGAVLVHLLLRTFVEYASNLFISIFNKEFVKTERIDIAWNTYLPYSVKYQTRDNSDNGVISSMAIPPEMELFIATGESVIF